MRRFDDDLLVGPPVTFHVGGFRCGRALGQRRTVQFQGRHVSAVLEGECPLCGAMLMPGDHGARCAHCVVEFRAERHYESPTRRITHLDILEVKLDEAPPSGR